MIPCPVAHLHIGHIRERVLVEFEKVLLAITLHSTEQFPSTMEATVCILMDTLIRGQLYLQLITFTKPLFSQLP